MTKTHTTYRDLVKNNRLAQTQVTHQGDNQERALIANMQDSIFAQPQVALQGDRQERALMTNMQDSIFAQPQAALQGDIQGCIS